MLKHGAVSGKVLEIQDLQHLESVVEKAGSSLLVVFFYTRSCGVCKELLRDFQQLCDEVRLQACLHNSLTTAAWCFVKHRSVSMLLLLNK
jgi:thiol-disulfide isomerase/thioredoxin